eukprot:CAMPEP_0202969292 /NCGR_PEP_ID=MMETSP1396-20130829/14966_1 /ASSEMBLY_ACC=CAM_ASM_000872 /TAXON_ID= /ORGANISM="Pseudokeronopsis sp., Strain Brazil" /LENGTH=47 /DNA_ID= /DNA_START= /DNA_END= /DNA_ORIENTATION=
MTAPNAVDAEEDHDDDHDSAIEEKPVIVGEPDILEEYNAMLKDVIEA